MNKNNEAKILVFSSDRADISIFQKLPLIIQFRVLRDGKMLAENGIYVKHLGIGWNEWRYFWNLWNHDGESPTKVEDFVVSGKEPGVPKIQELPSPCGEGEFSC